MKKWILFLVFVLVVPTYSFAQECTAEYGNGATTFVLATGSPGELGLLKALAADFTKANDTTMCWRKAGSGKSLSLLKANKVDVVMVHAPAAEKKAVAEGWAAKRTLIGSNEFYIVGPQNDPAGIASSKDAADAYQRIAKAKALFLSRGDNSGTHKKEMAIWKKTGVKPQGAWYQTTQDFMQATLLKAEADKGYFMTDSSTWVATMRDCPHLKVLFRGDTMLVNTYHALYSPTSTQKDVASRFIDFLNSAEGQKMMREYGKSLYGEAMYNDARYAAKYDH